MKGHSIFCLSRLDVSNNGILSYEARLYASPVEICLLFSISDLVPTKTKIASLIACCFISFLIFNLFTFYPFGCIYKRLSISNIKNN